jgi:hypothetical protein
MVRTLPAKSSGTSTSWRSTSWRASLRPTAAKAKRKEIKVSKQTGGPRRASLSRGNSPLSTFLPMTSSPMPPLAVFSSLVFSSLAFSSQTTRPGLWRSWLLLRLSWVRLPMCARSSFPRPLCCRSSCTWVSWTVRPSSVGGNGPDMLGVEDRGVGEDSSSVLIFAASSRREALWSGRRRGRGGWSFERQLCLPPWHVRGQQSLQAATRVPTCLGAHHWPPA